MYFALKVRIPVAMCYRRGQKMMPPKKGNLPSESSDKRISDNEKKIENYTNFSTFMDLHNILNRPLVLLWFCHITHFRMVYFVTKVTNI